jgi:type VI secretion system secreted protein VgrG
MYELSTTKYQTGELRVVSFRAVEQLSKPYSFDVLVLGKSLEASTLADDLIAERAHFHIAPESEAPRVIHGVIRRVAAEGSWGGETGRHSYRIRIAPRLHLLKRSQGSRIFQNLGVHEIVSKILDEWHIQHRWSLMRSPAAREYCVQYLESDFRFVSRILAEEGIFYWFEHPFGDDAEEVMVFGDAPHAIEPIEGHRQLELRDSSGMAELEEDIRRFELLDRARPLGTLLKEFDFMRPALDLRATSGPASLFAGLVPFAPGMPFPGLPDLGIPGVDLSALGDLANQGAAAGLDALEEQMGKIPGMGDIAGMPNIPGMPDIPGMPGVDDLMNALGALLPKRPYGGGERRIYEHLGEFERLGVDPAMAQRHLEAHRAKARVGKGTSRCRRLWPGRAFTLHGAAIHAHDGDYSVIRVEHEGHHPEYQDAGTTREVYRNTLWCVPHDVVPRPRRPKRRLQQVLETATVVGPPGEEIHTDQHGRIKVQFHWDLENIYLQFSSCWIRVMQPWSGPSWGFQFIPRVGMEVLVTFVGGDVDRPMILGCVPNAKNPVPFPLPREKTRSGIRTRSSRFGQGYNELSFDDRKGRENVFLRAERDLKEDVTNDHFTSVGHDQTLKVANNQTVMVSGTSFEAVATNRVASVGGDDIRHVGGQDMCSVDGSSARRVTGDLESDVAGNATNRVQGGLSEAVEHHHLAVVRGAREVFVGTEEHPVGARMATWGPYRITSSEMVTVNANESITLTCGDASLTVTQNTITLDAPKLHLVGGDEVVIECGGSRLKLDGNVALIGLRSAVHSAGASVELTDNAEVRGAQVALKGGGGDSASAEDQEPAPGTRRFRLLLSDGDSEAHASRRYVLAVGGQRFTGTTGSDGSLQHDIPDDAVSASLRLWITDHEVLEYSIELAAEVPEASTVAGALERLRTLGYYGGDIVEALTPQVQEALRYFQADRGLNVTGELDGATQGELQRRAGY